MGKAIPITYDDYCTIEAWMVAHGFRKVPGEEITLVFVANGRERRQLIRRGEVCFVQSANGYTVKICTTCLWHKVERCMASELFSGDEIVSRPPGEDKGWIIILNEKKKAIYFARPTLRTKSFVKRLIARAGITLKKVQRRPLCDECGHPMIIKRKRNRATFWACFRKRYHDGNEPVWKDWDFALTAKMLVIANDWREEYHRFLETKAAA